MRLIRAQIQTFRSIVDSGVIEIEDGVTVVIGKNEQGKSTLLKAIEAFNHQKQFAPSDFPNHLRPMLEDRSPTEMPITTLWFSIEPGDRQKLSGTIQELDTATELKAIKHYGNNYRFSLVDGAEERPLNFAEPNLTAPLLHVHKVGRDLREKLHSHAQRLPAFAEAKERIDQLMSVLTEARAQDLQDPDNLVKTFTTSIKTLPGTDAAITEDVAAANQDLEIVKEMVHSATKTDHGKLLQDALPSFILHSTKSDHIPNEVSIPDFVSNPDSFSKGMANLCRAAGLSVQKIRDLAATSDTAQREAYEDYYRGTISGGLNEFWTQAAYTVHFRIEKERLSVSISDGNYTQRIPPSDRSEGFQWYLSFYATLLNDVGSETILLLDNPGLEIHMDGQRDIKRFLEEKVAPTSQVIYVTHSPAMIDPFHLKQVRSVELQPNQQGTKVSNYLSKSGEDADLLEPVRSAVGMSLVSSLVLNEWNVLVEGAADRPVVEGIFYGHYKEHQPKVLVNGSLSESKDGFLVKFYERTGLPYVILLDADSSGRDLKAELVSLGIPESRILGLGSVFPDRQGEFATEDIVSEAFYHRAVLESYPKNPVDLPAPSAKKRATRYEEVFRATHNIGFNKRRVAETLKKLLATGVEDNETKANLGTLSTAIVERLKPATAATSTEEAKEAEEAAQ
ncbi:MAG TPA: AAA family ATPase [Bryobacteraceae bacterium]|jgi:predicted ATP-dependent endonuclease of OLD family|nr:AAA family ATPase [Bryobacteraceae bacterium]